MINGVPVNDLDYGTYNLGGRVSLNMVSRVEITMGPGSVKYGGTAALGVINVVLKTNSEFVGSMVEGDLNYSRGTNTRNLLVIPEIIPLPISTNCRLGLTPPSHCEVQFIRFYRMVIRCPGQIARR